MDDELDDEDWYEDDGELEDEQPVPCPECGAAIYKLAGRCPACGYWLSEADRSAKPRWVKVTAVVVLLAFLASLLGWLW